MDINLIILMVPAILVALTFHEYAHGYVAYRLGDPTAKHMGRLTLNPLAHLDPIGTLMIFIVRFGWAKPVPVDARNLANPKRDMLWIAAAGPLTNMALALVSGLLIRTLSATGVAIPGAGGMPGIIFNMLYLSVYINLALAIFNILPIPPLDGSKILAGILPDRYAPAIYTLEARGPFILMGIILFGMVTNIHILGFFIRPWVSFFSWVFAGI